MSAPPTYTGSKLISEEAYLISQATLFAIAIVTTVARTVIRLKMFKRLYWDDLFLFVAVAALIVGTMLNFYTAGFFTRKVSAINYESLLEAAFKHVMLSMVNNFCMWLAIYCVKFSFMMYFRTLMRRLPRVIKWWYVVLVVLALNAGVTVPGAFILCPYGNQVAMAQCVASPSFLVKELPFIYYSVVADVVTDVLLISIPVFILWQTQLTIREKMSIGVVLCMSVFMIAIAMIRGISARVNGTSDEIWTAFWVQTQGSVSITMTSFTAFRTLFVSNRGPYRVQRERRAKSPRRKFWRMKAQLDVPEFELQEPNSRYTCVAGAQSGSTQTAFTQPTLTNSGHDYRADPKPLYVSPRTPGHGRYDSRSSRQPSDESMVVNHGLHHVSHVSMV